jgi:hypothetical protein
MDLILIKLHGHRGVRGDSGEPEGKEGDEKDARRGFSFHITNP